MRSRYLFPFMFFVFTASLVAQVHFAPVVSFNSGGYTTSMAVADINGDAKPDVVVANYGNGGAGVLLGNGDGTFRPAVVYPAQDTVSVTVADVNLDGKNDVILADGASDKVGVLLGNGNGTLQPEVTYDSGGYIAYAVAVSDVNGDGKPDIVVANICANDYSLCLSGTVSVLFGGGDGTFATAVAYGSGGSSASSVAIADVNGDGKPDIVVGNDCDLNDWDCWASPGLPSTVGVLLGNGNGTFQPVVAYATGGYYTNSVAVMDVNGDGYPDLLVGKGGASTVGVLLGNGNGTFQPVVAYATGGYYTNSVAVMDVNGDGYADLVVGNCSLTSTDGCQDTAVATVSLLLGNGDGTFLPGVIYKSGGYHYAEAVAVDVNGDGKLDLIAANLCANSRTCDKGSVSVLINSKYGAFVQPPINEDGTSVFSAKRGVVPVKFNLTENDVPTCTLPTATISVTRTTDTSAVLVEENFFSTPADSGSNFRIDSSNCQYVYNLAASGLGIGMYRVDISINGIMVGHAVFALK